MEWLQSFEFLGIDVMDMLRISPMGAVLYGVGSFTMSSHMTRHAVEHSIGWCAVGLVSIVCLFALS